jgi:hypothetical protein
MESEIGFIAKVGGAIVAGLSVVGTIFGAGKYNATLVKKKELYHPDGKLIYMQAEDGKKCRDECDQTVAKITEETDKKFDKIIGYMKEQNDRHIQTTEFIGRVKQYMEQNK